MVEKSEVSAVSRVTTSGRKKKHCRECKKVFAGQHWANHLKSVHKNGDSPGFDFCTETEECAFCKGKYLPLPTLVQPPPTLVHWSPTLVHWSPTLVHVQNLCTKVGSGHVPMWACTRVVVYQSGRVPEWAMYQVDTYQVDTYPSGHTTSTSILTNLCIDTPTKSSSNRNKYYLCPTCPHRKLVRADTAMGKTGKCKCGTQLVLSSTAKSVIDE